MVPNKWEKLPKDWVCPVCLEATDSWGDCMNEECIVYQQNVLPLKKKAALHVSGGKS